jgi:hypothetical protein
MYLYLDDCRGHFVKIMLILLSYIGKFIYLYVYTIRYSNSKRTSRTAYSRSTAFIILLLKLLGILS